MKEDTPKTEERPDAKVWLSAGAALLTGGALGAYSLGWFGGEASTPNGNTVEIVENTSGITERPQPAPRVDGPDRVPANGATDTPISVPVIDPPLKPAVPAVVPKPQRPIRVLEGASFVVRFEKDATGPNECAELFRKDKDAARIAFAKWADGKPEFAGLSLERANYSGELILAYDASEDSKPATSARDMQRRLQSAKGVKYADPDYKARPGKGD